MEQYAILAYPGHNRVYFNNYEALSLAELELACRVMETPCHGLEVRRIAGVPYYVFTAGQELSRADWQLLCRLSFVYAVFRLEGEGEEMRLFPKEGRFTPYLKESLSTILRYSGKTNELFTRLLINAARCSSDFAGRERLSLLDPVSGKGTTLFEGLLQGCDVYGVELADKAVQESTVYLKKFLETEKCKHSFHKERISGKDRSFTAVKYRFELAPDKESFRSEEGRRNVTVVAGDTLYTARYFKKNSIHLIAGDLPYGVAHGNVAGERRGGGHTRSPGRLLKDCLPGWREVLLPGGAMALSWNTFVLPRRELAGLLEEAGFSVCVEAPYDSMEHRVDQAIKRDVIVARKEK